jgi:hypothetical protein
VLAVFFARFVPPIRAFVPITAGALGMPPLRFYPVNIAAILLWAPAHILPGVLAVSALDRAGGLAGLEGTAKHYWMPLVIGGALIVAVIVWIIRRRRGGNAIEPASAGAQGSVGWAKPTGRANARPIACPPFVHTAVILRCSPFFTASLEGWATSAYGHPSRRAQERAPQDDGGGCVAIEGWWARREERLCPPYEAPRTTVFR